MRTPSSVVRGRIVPVADCTCRANRSKTAERLPCRERRGENITWYSVSGSRAAENSGQISGTIEHSQYECPLIAGFENDQVVSVYADPYRVAQVRTRDVAQRPVGNLLAVLPYLLNE